jgi:hypothetical protein
MKNFSSYKFKFFLSRKISFFQLNSFISFSANRWWKIYDYVFMYFHLPALQEKVRHKEKSTRRKRSVASLNMKKVFCFSFIISPRQQPILKPFFIPLCAVIKAQTHIKKFSCAYLAARSL